MNRQDYDRLITDIVNKLDRDLEPKHFATNTVNNVLIAAGIDIPEPPILPGVTPGIWIPCCGHDADTGKYYIIVNNVRIATVYGSPGNRQVMAASKETTEALVSLLRWLKTCEWEAEDGDVITKGVAAALKAGAKI